MKLLKVSLKANESSYLAIAGSLLTAITLTDKISVTFNGDEGFTTEILAGLSIRPPRPYDSMMLLSATDQDIEIMAGFGAVTDARLILAGSDLEITVKGSGTITAAAVSVAITATLIAAADVNRTSLLIQSAGEIFIGGAGVTVAAGVKMSAGQSMEIKTSAAVYGISPLGSIDCRVLSEVK